MIAQLYFAAEYELAPIGAYELAEAVAIYEIEKLKNSEIEKVNAFFAEYGKWMELFGIPDGFLKEIAEKLIDGIADIANKLVSWVIKKIKNRGSKKTYPKETIDVNLSALKNSKSQLENANMVISRLDFKLDKFRKALGAHEVFDWADAAKIDLEMTGSNIVENAFEQIVVKGKNVNIQSCVGYLEAVITQLETTEDLIIRAVGGA